MSALDLHADDLILFAHIAEAGSFTRAAEQIGLPKSTLSRRLSDLEERLGQRLMHRSTRRLALSEFGEAMLIHAHQIRDECEAATAFATHQQADPQGILRISAPPSFPELPLVEIITAYSLRYPDVQLELDLSARRVDLIGERFDLALRAAAQLPDDSTLVARRIRTFTHGLYASPAYLAANGMPMDPAELQGHKGLALATGDGREMWQLSCGDRHWQGLPRSLFSANSMEIHRALAAEGMGIVGLSDAFAAPVVAGGGLRRVLPDWHLPSSALWYVTPGRRLLPRRTTAFITVLKEAMTH